MRKSTRKILSIILTICMCMALIPMGVFAASAEEPAAAPGSTLGSADAEYQLNIVNDADALILYNVQINDKSERVPIKANESFSVGINEGDVIKVTKAGNSNYRLSNASASFASSGYEAAIDDTFTYTVGAGFKVGEEYAYTYKDGADYAGEAATMNGKTVAADTATEGTVTLSYNNSRCIVTLNANGETTTSTISGNFTTSGSNATNSQAKANDKGTQIQNAANALWAAVVAGLDLDETFETANATINTSYNNGVLGIGRSVSWSVSGKYYAYQPLNVEVKDVVDPVDAGDVTLTYTTETQAKAGNFTVNVLNGERLTDLDNKINTELLSSLMGMLTSGQGEEGAGMSMDTFGNLLNNEDLMGLVAIEALDNMPKGFQVVLTEVDKGDGLYEGLTYTVPMTETMFIDIDMDAMMQDALGSLLYGMAKGQIPEALLNLKMKLPVSIGQTFADEGIRAGQYKVTITSPGEGWYSNTTSYTVNITDGGTASGLGGTHTYGQISTSSAIRPMLEAMGMGSLAGCVAGLGSLVLAGRNITFVDSVPGVVFSHKQNHIEFTNAMLSVAEDGKVTTMGIPGATFTLVDRDRFLGLIDSLLAMGRTAVNSVIGGISFDELLGLREEITEGDPEEPVDAEPGMIERILISIIALGPELDGFKIPAILENVADENGLVTFDPENNVTLQKLFDLIPVLTNAVSGIGDIAGGIGGLIPGGGNSSEPGEPAEPGEDGEEPATPAEPSGGSSGSILDNLGGLDMASVLELLGAIGDPDQIVALMGLLESIGDMGSVFGGGDSEEPSEPADPSDPTEPGEPAEETDMMQVIMNLLQEFGGGDLGTAVINFIGLSEGRFPTGNYLLIQTAVPEGRTRNPMMYVFENEWNAEERAYHTYASVDLAGVMNNEAFATFAGQLEQSYELLSTVFGNLAGTADAGLSVARAFIGAEGEGYNSEALFDMFDDISRRITAAYANAQNPDAETPSEGIPLISASLKQALSFILDTVLDTYIPKATVLSYVTKIIYENTGNLFESEEEVASVLTSLAMDGDLTFTDFNNKVQAMLADADYVLNGEVTKNWYYYDVSPNIFTNINVVYHYVVTQMLPPELANVVLRALQGQIDVGEEMINELINQILNPDTGDVEVPDEPDAPDLPGTNTGSWLSRLFGGLFGGGFGNIFSGIGNFFSNLFGRWF